MRIRLALSFVGVLFGCATPSVMSEGSPPRVEVAPVEPPKASPRARTRNVILVTVDGTRWQEIFGGVDPTVAARFGQSVQPRSAAELVPNLSKMRDEGLTIGAAAEMIASAPSFVSLPGYLELLSGRATPCRTNDCAATREPTLLDELRDELRLSDHEIAVIASWERIERAASHAQGHITVSAGRHHGATRDGVRVSPVASELLDTAARAPAFPGEDDYRPDPFTEKLALEYVAHRAPRFLFVALGDTDEWAHRGDYVRYLDALHDADRFIGDLRALLAAMGDYGAETTVLVTTDHGRSDAFVSHGALSPESGRVWLVAAGASIPPTPRVAQTKARLTDVAPAIRALLDLPPALELSQPVWQRDRISAFVDSSSAHRAVPPLLDR